MNDWLNLTAMARSLEIPEPTARRYAKLFADYLPHRKMGHITMYAPDTAPILSRISQLYSQGKKKEDIEAVLKKEFPQPDNVPAVGDYEALVKNDNTALQEKLFQFLETVSDQNKKIDALMERENQTSATITRLEEELSAEKNSRKALEESSSKYKQALCILYRSYKEHHALIETLREQSPEEGSTSEMKRIDQRLNHLEDMFLEDMGQLQKIMNHVLKCQES